LSSISRTRLILLWIRFLTNPSTGFISRILTLL